MKKVTVQHKLDREKLLEFPFIKDFALSDMENELGKEVMKSAKVYEFEDYDGGLILNTQLLITTREEVKEMLRILNNFRYQTPTDDEIDRLIGLLTGEIYKEN